MARFSVLILLCCLASAAKAEELPTSPVEKYLHAGNYAAGESAMLQALDVNPADDEARFGLGVLQFFRAVENLGRALHEYGAISEKTRQPFLRLPVPANENPATISYQEFRRVLDLFGRDLARAESTLADIQHDLVKLRLRLASIRLDFTGSGENPVTLLEVINKVNRRPIQFPNGNADFRIHFDRGDVAWLRAYCHLLMGMVDATLAMDGEIGFEKRSHEIFPKIETFTDEEEHWEDGVDVIDAPRLRRMRLHFLMVAKLNPETWKYIRAETDDDFEWLSNANQTDQLGLPISNEQVDRWLAMMKQFEELLDGKRLFPGSLLTFVNKNHDVSLGMNFKTVFDNPPENIFNRGRIEKEGFYPQYLEPQTEKPVFDLPALFAVFQLFDGPLGAARAFRLN
ncbi:MAG: hypothetical protein KDA78_03445 [Planctomycetaceae bacterium]|nr:hypothetical protein [Planctomycetaceae bacterium]